MPSAASSLVRKLTFLSALIAFQIVMAQGQNSAKVSAVNTSQIKVKKNEAQSTETKTWLEFKAKGLSYTEASPVDNTLQQQVQAGIKLRKAGTFFSEAELAVGTFSRANSVYYELPQAYVGYGTRQNNITAGRKIENLSFADSFYNFGLMQAFATNDAVQFTAGGLTGLSGRIGSDSYGLLAGFNPIFIPNQRPQSNFEDGRVVTTNRWAAAPPARFKFGNDFKDINYALKDYKLTDIISHSGFMLNAYAGGTRKRPLLLATYANKPINDIVLSRDTYSDISNFQGYVQITPKVFYHQIYALDVNLDSGRFKSTFSVLADQPVNKEAEALEFIQNLEPLEIYSAYVALDLSEYFGKKFEVYSAAAVINGGGIKDLNAEKKESSIAIANSRTQFKKPFVVGMKSDLFFIYNRAVATDVKLTYDQQLRGSLLSAEMRYSPNREMTLSLGADIIGVENELPSDAQGNFLDQNKANDRLTAGFGYVF